MIHVLLTDLKRMLPKNNQFAVIDSCLFYSVSQPISTTHQPDNISVSYISSQPIAIVYLVCQSPNRCNEMKLYLIYSSPLV